MATLRETEDAYDRHQLKIGVIHSAVADVILKLEAELTAARAALDQIDRHVVGACARDTGAMPEPCEECGEMREIAAQALAEMKEARK